MPKESGISSASLNARKAAYDRPEVIRAMYNGLAANREDRARYINVFLEFLPHTSGIDAYTAVLSEDEVRNLRNEIFIACFNEVSDDVMANGPVDPVVRARQLKYHRAIQVLGPPTEEDPYNYQLLYALLCMKLDRHRETQQVTRRMLAQQPGNAFETSLLEYATDNVSLPRFQMAFPQRCIKAWEVTAKAIQKYCKSGKDEYMNPIEIRDAFDLWAGLSMEVTNVSTKYFALEFSPYNWDLSLFPTQTAIYMGEAELPKESANSRNLYLGAAIHHPDLSLPNGEFLFLDDAVTAVTDTPEHNGIHLKLYHPALAGAEPSPWLTEAVTIEVMRWLNPAAFCILVRSLEILKGRPRNSTGTLETVEEQIEALGYACNYSMEDVKPLRMRQTYTRLQKKAAGQRLRDDILRGETSILRLQEEYERNETAAADYFTDRGIAPVFLAIPLSIVEGKPEEFIRGILDALGDDTNLKILGRAYGSWYCYLDLLLYNTVHVVDLIEAHLSRIPCGDAVRIQSFYYDAYPCPVSRAYMAAHNMIAPGFFSYAKNSASPEAAHGHGSAAPKPKTKKKNAAKAKRKHSKKFH